MMVKEKELIKNTVKVSRIIYHNQANGWGVFCYINDGKYDEFKEAEVKISGNFRDIYVDSEVEIEGKFYDHATYGPQISLTSYKVIANSDSKDAIIDFLVRSSISGIGVANANKIYKKFGKDSIDIVLHHSERLQEIDGIAGKIYDRVKKSIDEYLKQEELIKFCTELGGIPHFVINRIYGALGDKAVSILKENPYALLQFSTLTFNQVDNIAMKMGIATDNDERLKAGLLYVLINESVLRGSTGCLSDELRKRFNNELGFFGNNLYQYALNKLEENKLITVEFNEVYPRDFYDAEKKIAEFLNYMRFSEISTNYDKLIITEEINNFPFKLNEQQIKTILSCLSNKFSIITSVAGGGKSTITKAIVNILERHDENVILVSPTGKASKRLAECTQREAKTIHRFLGVKQDVKDAQPEKVPPKTTIIIDEASMVDVILLSKVIDSLQGDTRLILVGDTHQLPSVQAGNILEDIIESKQFNVCTLTDIMRQAEHSNIIKYCSMVNDGKTFNSVKSNDFLYVKSSDQDSILQNFIKLYEKSVKIYGLQETQVITPYKLGKLGMNNLNNILKDVINPNDNKDKVFNFDIGDKVKHNKNNYKKEVFNGETGIVCDIILANEVYDLDGIDDILVVDYGDRKVSYTKDDIHELQLSYASTVHASQGSEYKSVFVLLDNEVSNVLLIRKIIYTALSRAKEKCILFSTNNCVETAILNDYYKPRITKLQEFLEEGI